MEKYGTILYLAIFVAIFYFLLIRPQQQRQKQHQKTINSLAPNVNVTTYGGILGTVVRVKDSTVILKIAENVKVEVLKTSIAYISKEDEPDN